MDFSNLRERLELENKLKQGVVKVWFTKKDETEREMRCTLKEGLTESYEKKTERKRPVNTETISVFDLDIKEWRSFRFDSIIKVEYE